VIWVDVHEVEDESEFVRNHLTLVEFVAIRLLSVYLHRYNILKWLIFKHFLLNSQLSFDFFNILLVVLENVKEVTLYVETIPLVVKRIHHQLLVTNLHQGLALRLVIFWIVLAAAFTLGPVILLFFHHGVGLIELLLACFSVLVVLKFQLKNFNLVEDMRVRI